ncbi:MAG: hypothetical protein U0441_26165 [Polyangiaceae bacterium]
MTTPRDIDSPDSASREDEASRAADRATRALRPVAPLPAAFKGRVLRAARAEMTTTQTRWLRLERFTTRVLVPAALIASAVGWMYHVAHVAERVFALHGG